RSAAEDGVVGGDHEEGAVRALVDLGEPDRSEKGPAEIVLLERELFLFEERARVERTVAEIFKYAAVKLVGPGLEAEADQAGPHHAVLGRERAFDDVELGDGVDGRTHLGEGAEVLELAGGHAVDEDIGL